MAEYDPSDPDGTAAELAELRQLVRKQDRAITELTKRVTELERKRRADAGALVGRR